MSDPGYELLVHFERGVHGVAVTHAFVSEWARSKRPPLKHFSKSVEVTPERSWLEERLGFEGGREDSGLTLRTGRRRTGVDVFECMFTNPSVVLAFAANFISLRFYHNAIQRKIDGYTLDDLADLLAAVADAGPIRAGGLDAYRNGHADLTRETRRRFSATVAGKRSLTWVPLQWLTILPPTVMKTLEGPPDRLERSGLLRLRNLRDGGAIVAISREPPRGDPIEVTRAQRCMRALGWL